MKVNWETLLAAVLVAASILFVCRYQISAVGIDPSPTGGTAFYRLDRWTGDVVACTREIVPGPGIRLECPAPVPDDLRPH